MTTTNLLVAIKNIVTNPITNLTAHYNSSSNRVNSEGEALENYIKDIFCGTVNTTDENQRNQIFSQHFSYLGNQNNPPDIMIRGGDAIEVKKMESNGSGIALNSSYPKDVLYSDSPMLTEACKVCEAWTQKDLLYSVGVAPKGKLVSLWFVYGDCYFANRNFYQQLLNVTDPLKVTTFNFLKENSLPLIRSMALPPEQLIEKSIDTDSKFLNALMSKKRYESFPFSDRNDLETLKESGLLISDFRIHSPSDPSIMIDAKFISYQFIQ